MKAKIKVRQTKKAKKWSARVTKTSHALALDAGVFTWDDPKRIARSLSRSAERSKARKAGPYQSAMSMLNFYINRVGQNVPADRKRVLYQAKDELRKIYKRQ